MKSITADYFECTVRYDKTMDNGAEKQVTEAYVVDAMTFTEAESRIASEMEKSNGINFFIRSINRAPYKEIAFTECSTDDRWYKVKVAIINIDDYGREKESPAFYLVQGNSIANAQATVNELFKNTMLDYKIKASTETKILDVYMHANG